MSASVLRTMRQNGMELLGLEDDGHSEKKGTALLLGGALLAAAVISFTAALAGAALTGIVYFGGRSLVRRMSR